MGIADLHCGSTANLFYEPEGLLLHCCLLPADDEHLRHLLTFQLGYLGCGQITVDVVLEGGPVMQLPTTRAEPAIVAARLGGVNGMAPQTGSGPASPHLSYITAPDGQVRFKYTVWGQAAAADDSLRGELCAVVSGHVPNLTVTTRSGATRTVPRAPRRAPQTNCPAGSPATRQLVHGHR